MGQTSGEVHRLTSEKARAAARNKNDAADADAICEAVRRPTMRFVQVKSAE
jgi:transposase